MSYCVNCGVKLADSEKKCPLCQTEVINPNIIIQKSISKPYPDNTITFKILPNSVKTLLVTVIFILPVAVSLICNYSISSVISWSKFVVLSLIFAYSISIYSILCFKRNSNVFNILVYHVLLCTYLFAMNKLCKGNWFLTFAVPLVLLLFIYFLVITLVITRNHLTKLFCTGFIMLLSGVFCVFLETILNFAFKFRTTILWSIYPCITLFIISIVLFIIDFNKPLKEQLGKKLFL